MQKEGEVKILRDKLKKQESEMQRVRNEKLELLKKLQQQQIEAKKNLEKQIEFKELENQFKSQELTDLTMKCKQLEAKLKKSQNSVNPPLNLPTASSRIENPQKHSQDITSSMFDEEFSRRKSINQQAHPPLNPSNVICNKGKIEFKRNKYWCNLI